MFEILMYLFESYFDAGRYPPAEKLSRKLSAAGFEGEEIDEALSWLAGLEAQTDEHYPDQLQHGGVRHFAAMEQKYIHADGLRFLLFAEQQKLLAPVEREMILDRAVALRQEQLPLDKLKLIMLMVLWNRHQDMDPLLVEELITPYETAQRH